MPLKWRRQSFCRLRLLPNRQATKGDDLSHRPERASLVAARALRRQRLSVGPEQAVTAEERDVDAAHELDVIPHRFIQDQAAAETRSW